MQNASVFYTGARCALCVTCCVCVIVIDCLWPGRPFISVALVMSFQKLEFIMSFQKQKLVKRVVWVGLIKSLPNQCLDIHA